jgi:murein DD-endopeptidase MepM/ murein hydrolase activator NlpD
MTGFKGNRWIRSVFAWRGKNAPAPDEAVQNASLTGPQEGSKQAKSPWGLLRERKWPIVQTVSVLGLTAVMVATGHHYVEANMVEVYHVMVDGADIGIVSSKDIVNQYIAKKQDELKEQFPNVHMELPVDGVSFEAEKAFKKEADNAAVLAELDRELKPQAYGVELRVDGKLFGLVKDEATANAILEQIKAPFLPKGKDAAPVTALAEGAASKPDNVQVDKVDFVQNVQLQEVKISPNDVMKPEDVLKKLQAGDTQPTTYVVQKGDCVSCIAKKFGIPKQLIYQKNPWINDDMIKVGDKLDLTVLKPPLSVKTEETVVENQEVQYDTDYIKDDTLRAGVIQPISPGKNGLKKVTFHVTKIDGQMVSEEVTNEEMIEPPVTAKARKGTKVVLGEGTGKFAWPVLGPTITSPFGMRWGKLHKGIDITGNTTILAADNGKVVETGYKDDYGNYVIINHQNGYETLYGHLSTISVSQGKIVEKGEKIGVMGATGDATGVHLHFEIHKNGSLENPLKYLNK